MPWLCSVKSSEVQATLKYEEPIKKECQSLLNGNYHAEM